jgi:hypothetical protein
MIMGNNRINDYKKCRQIDDNFDCHAARAIRCDAHHPMECIRGFMEATRCSHWASAYAILTLAAAMVDNFE